MHFEERQKMSSHILAFQNIPSPLSGQALGRLALNVKENKR